MRFIFDSYSRGLLKPELVVLAQERYGKESKANASDMGVDIERLRREQDMSGVRVDPEIAAMPLEAFDMYIHEAVASAAVEEVVNDVIKVEEENPTVKSPDEESSEVPYGEVYELDPTKETDMDTENEEEEEEEPLAPPKPVNDSGFDWGDMGEEF